MNIGGLIDDSNRIINSRLRARPPYEGSFVVV
jgi:hypothetical protein